MSRQLTLWAEGPAILDQYDAMTERTHRPGLRIWSGALRDWFADLLAHRGRAYEQCMLLEVEVEHGDTDKALARLGRIKGMLAALCLALLGCSMIPVAREEGPETRRPRGQVRIVRVVREG